MATANFGEWGAFTVRDDVRFQQTVDGRKRLVKETAVPLEVASLLRKNLGFIQTKNEIPKAVMDEFANSATPEINLTPTPQPDKPNIGYAEPLAQPESAGLHPIPMEPADSRDREALMQENEQLKEVIANMDSFAIHTANIKDIAQALFERFGIYTVWLGRFPQADEVNPFTGMPMSNYERGIAYQAAVRFQTSGMDNPEIYKAQMKQNAEAAQNIQYAPAPKNMLEHREQDSFEYRTSVEGERDRANVRHTVNPDDPDDPILEPMMGKQVIRPQW